VPVSGVGLEDFTVTRNGLAVPLVGMTLKGSGASYTLNLSAITNVAGAYVLTLVASSSGIVDELGNPLVANAQDDWVIDTNRPTADIVEILSPRNVVVGDVTIQFSESVTGLDLGDFVLQMAGNDVDISGATLSGSGSVYTLNLSSVPPVKGKYLLTLVAAGSQIEDMAGNELTADAKQKWVISSTVDKSGKPNGSDTTPGVPSRDALMVINQLNYHDSFHGQTKNVTERADTLSPSAFVDAYEFARRVELLEQPSQVQRALLAAFQGATQSMSRASQIEVINGFNQEKRLNRLLDYLTEPASEDLLELLASDVAHARWASAVT